MGRDGSIPFWRVDDSDVDAWEWGTQMSVCGCYDLA